MEPGALKADMRILWRKSNPLATHCPHCYDRFADTVWSARGVGGVDPHFAPFVHQAFFAFGDGRIHLFSLRSPPSRKIPTKAAMENVKHPVARPDAHLPFRSIAYICPQLARLRKSYHVS
jgi:hypothetical protein